LHGHARLADAGHAGHGMALVLERFDDEVADRVLILHHQDIDLAHREPPWGSRGSSRVKVAPWPGRLSTASVPPWRLTMSWVMYSPSPVPLGLVVKNGSNSVCRVCASMPPPSSETLASTASPPRRPRASRTRTLDPCGEASAAFFRRLMNTCCIWSAS